MPYCVKKLEVYPLIYKRAWGMYDDAQSIASIEELYQLPAYATSDELHDLTAVTDYQVTYRQLAALAEDTVEKDQANKNPFKRVAYVVASDVGFGSGRVYQAISEGSSEDFRVFRSLETAMEWLGVPLSALDEIEHQSANR